MPPPIAKPTPISTQVSASSGAPSWPSVVRMAIAMPSMPIMLPRRDVSGLESPRSARMNSTPAMR